MKKLLVGLLVLGSFSVFAEEQFKCGKVASVVAQGKDAYNYIVQIRERRSSKIIQTNKLGEAGIALAATAYANGLEVCIVDNAIILGEFQKVDQQLD